MCQSICHRRICVLFQSLQKFFCSGSGFLHLFGESQPTPVHQASSYDSGMAIMIFFFRAAANNIFGHFTQSFASKVMILQKFLDKMSFRQPAGHKFLLAIYFGHWAKGTLCLALNSYLYFLHYLAFTVMAIKLNYHN